MDMTKTIEPKSDQMNYDDFLTGTKTITISGVERAGNGTDAQPVNVHYQGDNGKPYKPCKSMRRVMVRAWGLDGADYVGKSMTLYGDPKVIFGGKEVGGIRISHMSHIDKEINMALSASKTKKVSYKVLPLKVDMVDTEIVGGEKHAKQGMEAYKAFYESLSPADQKIINNSGDHDKFKQIAEDADNVPENDDFPGDK